MSKSKKKTRTQRVERQLEALDLLARVGTLSPALEAKHERLRIKLLCLYEGRAKRQARGLVTRLLHDVPPFERHEIDRTEPEKPHREKLVQIFLTKSAKRSYNAILRGQSMGENEIRRGIYRYPRSVKWGIVQVPASSIAWESEPPHRRMGNQYASTKKTS